jgi:Ca2+-binding EF-hand superfamily protein
MGCTQSKPFNNNNNNNPSNDMDKSSDSALNSSRVEVKAKSAHDPSNNSNSSPAEAVKSFHISAPTQTSLATVSIYPLDGTQSLHIPNKSIDLTGLYSVPARRSSLKKTHSKREIPSKPPIIAKQTSTKSILKRSTTITATDINNQTNVISPEKSKSANSPPLSPQQDSASLNLNNTLLVESNGNANTMKGLTPPRSPRSARHKPKGRSADHINSLDISNNAPSIYNIHSLPTNNPSNLDVSCAAAPPTITAAAAAAVEGTQSQRRRRRLQRRASHKGAMSKLALRFPLIKRSFERVHGAFLEFHRQRLVEEEESRSKLSGLSAAQTPNGTFYHLPLPRSQQNTFTSVSAVNVHPNPANSAAVSRDPAAAANFVLPSAPDHPSTSSGGSTPTILTQTTQNSTQTTTQLKRRKLFEGQAIGLDKLHVLLSIIGEKKIWSNAEVQELFNLADLDRSKTISFREFLICIAVGYFLKVEDSSDEKFLEIQRGFRVIQEAFKLMDSNNSNSVEAEELKSALLGSIDNNNQANLVNSEQAAKNQRELLESRFAELDFNADGSVSFAEFLFGFITWVSFDEAESAANNHIYY